MFRRLAAALLLLGLFPAAAEADRLVLLDGRTFTGTVTVERNTVLVEMNYGTLRFSKDQVAQIEFRDTPEAELAGRLAGADRSDPDQLCEIAAWAHRQELTRQAEDLYRQALQLDPDHRRARRALGYVLVDGQWRSVEQALELARSKLEAGQHSRLLDDLLPKLSAMSTSPQRRVELTRLKAHALLRSGQFTAAGAAFRQLVETADGADSARFKAVADVLKANPDGMYVLTETYPPHAGLLGETSGVLEPGPAPLTDPRVLKAALRDQAKTEIRNGRELMSQARKLSETDPDAARARYYQASQAFDRADAMVPRIAHSYRVELARQRISRLREDVESSARHFDQSMSKLGESDLSPQQYRDLVSRMLRRLDTIREGLNKIIELTEPYPRELVLEAQWARADLEKIESMRQMLAGELHGEN